MKNPIFTLTTLAFLGLSTTYAQVKVGDNPTSINSSAAFEVESTTKGILPPRMTSAQRNAIASPAEGLTVYNTEVNCLQWFNGTGWYNVCDGSVAIPTVFGANGVEWMDRNLGASQVATSSTDADSYGDLYQWGRAADGHEKRDSDTYDAVVSTDGVANFNASGNAWDGQFILRNSGAQNWVDPSVTGVDDLWQGVSGTNNPCPSGYRLPTEAEWNAERSSWTPNNAAGAFASPLKLPVAGGRNHRSGSLNRVNDDGFYWSTVVLSTFARDLQFTSSSALINNSNRAYGRSVRCLKD